MAVAVLALFVALSSSAVALKGKNTVDSGDIKNGAVRSSDARNESLTGTDIQGLTGADVNDESLTGNDVTGLAGTDINDNSLTGADVSGLTGGDVTDDSLTGNDIDESSLDVVPFASQASGAANSGQLGGLPASAYQQKCQSGDVEGIVEVDADATFSATFTQTGVTPFLNCAPGSVQARRISAGVYHVRFNGLGSVVALGVVDSASSPNNFVTIDEVNDGGAAFEVHVIDTGASAEDFDFFLVAL
jgi:hypothetical protein